MDKNLFRISSTAFSGGCKKMDIKIKEGFKVNRKEFMKQKKWMK